MKRLLPGFILLALIAGAVLVAIVAAAVQIPALQPVGLLGLGLVIGLFFLARRPRREPGPPVLQTRRWVPNTAELA